METHSQTTLKMSEAAWSASNHSWQEFSLFGDGSCGEPLINQHLVLDFTPDEELDNEYVQRKCCAFWEFIGRQPELQSLMVSPEPNIYRKNMESSDSSPEPEPVKTPQPVEHARTAVSMLEIVEGKGLIDRIFEAKLPQTNCSLGSREYHEDDSPLPRGRMSLQKTVCKCNEAKCTICRRQPSAPSSPRAAHLCRKLQDWDTKHPKSMDPPGHPPVLSHSVMQRKIIS